ncbi:tetratricopeptide repeat-containing sulfotransferase family protein [Novosphingobium decolorationis]|uniref:Sulfotransferase n=1 Tax=Novosphingobium decolorationis TaxID=2698673 RepID=A0ABX8E7C9_9SPHN|nr:sulfotransferase [Novosphingobium decolorationis]MED5544548.1 sulfotransferase [Pseudomonadota bacterium]QVM83961.1 sulfotransferase [Novosphingobium decolorationis]
MTLEDQARTALRRGDIAGAATAAQTLCQSEPSHPAGPFLAGMAAAESGQFGKALPLLQRAAQMAPGNAEYLAQLAKTLILLRRDGEAGEVAARALALPCTDPLALDTLGCVLARLGDHEASLAPFTRAVDGAPDNFDYRYNLAAALGFTGKVEEARTHYETILAADPGNARVHYALSIVARQTREANNVARLENVLASDPPPGDTLRLRYALAKELEDIGAPAEAFAQLHAANTAHKRATGYDFAQDAAIFEALETLFQRTDTALATQPGCPDAAPIFVVGMPRTGTTLVDRILSSHRDVEATGELQAMPLAVKQMARTPSRQVIDAPTIAASANCAPAAIGEAYLVRARHHRRSKTPRFTDKLPANFLYIGHILQALPNARIVCLRRGAMDTVWSNLRNLFATTSAYYAYSYDLMDTARYYARFDALMAFWETRFPGRVLQFGYEALVDNQEEETRRLLAHCELDWDAACLDFHRNTAAVATPSAAQVRRTLNRDGIGRWKTHAADMEKVAAFFHARGIALN